MRHSNRSGYNQDNNTDGCYFKPEGGKNKIIEFFIELGEYFVLRQDIILQRFYEHVWLSGLAILITGIIAVPTGVFITRKKKIANFVINLTSIMYTIPALALFGLFITIPGLGIGTTSALVALVVYGLLPLVRNTYVGIMEVDPAILEAAEGMGTTKLQRLLMIELPLAFPVILAGFRTMTVMTIAVTTIASFIGAGGLGSLIMRGIHTVNNMMILAGALPVAFIAITAELTLGYFEKTLRRRVAPPRNQ